MGLTQALVEIRNSIDLLRSQTNVCHSQIEERLTALEDRLDRIESPTDNAKRLKLRGSDDFRKTAPVPERPAVMKEANIGVDPR